MLFPHRSKLLSSIEFICIRSVKSGCVECGRLLGALLDKINDRFQTELAKLTLSGGLSLLLFIGLLTALPAKNTAASSQPQVFPWGTATVGDEVYGITGPSPVRCHEAVYQNARLMLDAQRISWMADVAASIPQGVALHSPISGASGTAVNEPVVLQHADGFTLTVIPVSLATNQGFNSGSASTGVPSYSNVQIHGGSSGCTMQDYAPKASPITSSDLYFNQLNNLSGLNGIRFTFPTPVLGFGGFFGDLETSFRGTTAFMRLLDENQTLLADVPIPSTIGMTGGIAAENILCDQTSVDDAQVASQGLQPGCGNGSNRWVGFISNTPVAQALVVVGDNDPLPDGQGTNEKLSAMGITVVRVLPTSEIAIVKAAPLEVTVDESFIYTLTASNTSNNMAAALIITDTAPNGVTFDAVSGPNCALSDNQVRCSQETLAAGSAISILIQATAQVTSSITNTAILTAANDANPSNNEATASVTPLAAPPVNYCAEPATGGDINSPALIINEVLYNEAGSAGDEWVELVATRFIAEGEQFFISDNETGGSRFERLIEIPAGGIPAGTYIMIHDDAGTDDLDVGDGLLSLWNAGLANPASTHLNNGGDNLTLYQGNSVVDANAIDYLRYDNDTTSSSNDAPPASLLWGGFAPGGAVNEQSIARIENGVDGSSGADWALSGTSGTTGPSTPGAHNAGLASCNVAVTKSGPSTALVDSSFDYTISVSNTTELTITNVIVTDTAPTGVLFQQVGGQSCNLANNAIRCAVDSLAPGSSQSITVSAISTVSGVLTNTVIVAAEYDSIATDNRAAHVTIIEATGAIGDYVYVDTNGNGIQDQGETTPINGVELILASAGVTVTVTTLSEDGHYLFEDLTPGTYTVTVATPSGFERTGPASYTVALDSGGLITHADFGFRYALVDVSVAKSGPPRVTIGNTVDYPITVTNSSTTNSALDVTLIDTLPVGALLTEIPDVRCALETQGVQEQLICHLGNIAPQETVLITPNLQLMEGSQMTNTVEIAGTNEIGGLNNFSSATTEVLAPRLQLDKTMIHPGAGQVVVGQVITFALRVSNIGEVSVAEVQLKDTFEPDRLRFLAADPQPDFSSGDTLTWIGAANGSNSLSGNVPLNAGDIFTVTATFEAIKP